MEQIIVDASPRETRGKNAARRVRTTGHVPAVMYGGKGEAQALQVNTKQLTAILRSASGHNTIFKVKSGGVEQTAIVKDWLVDPVKGNLLHVDLLRVAMDVRMRVKVPVHTFGEAQGVKLQGGIFEIVIREVEIECLPADIPTEFRMDISNLMIGMQLRASDIPVDPEKIKMLTDPARVLSHVVTLRVEEEKPAEAVAGEAAAAPAEPEVIKKGKKDAEEGEEGEGAPAEKEKEEVAAADFQMRVIVGLGNPGIEYAWTPHNLGFLAVDKLAEQANIRVTRPESKSYVGVGKIAGQEVALAKPQTMMNLSGLAVRELVRRAECQPSDVIVICDDFALPWGMLRVRERGSAGGHNGLKSVIGELRTLEFPRVRLGVQPGDFRGDLREYVLHQISREEEDLAAEEVERGAEAVTVMLAEGIEAAMNRFNRRVPSPGEVETDE